MGRWFAQMQKKKKGPEEGVPGKTLLQPGVTCSGLLRGDWFPSRCRSHEFPLALLQRSALTSRRGKGGKTNTLSATSSRALWLPGFMASLIKLSVSQCLNPTGWFYTQCCLSVGSRKGNGFFFYYHSWFSQWRVEWVRLGHVCSHQHWKRDQSINR